MVVDRQFIKDKFPTRSDDANKYSVGTVLCVCGSYSMAGAAILCAKAALRTGAGMVRLAVPEGIYTIVSAAVPEAVFLVLPQSESGAVCESAIGEILKAADKSDVVLMGCGSKLCKDTVSIALALAHHAKTPLCLDADGINAVSKHIDVLKERAYPTVLTPHEGEMSRLTGLTSAKIGDNRITVAQNFANKCDVVVALKGKYTVVAQKSHEPFINPTGNSGLAVAGSGDVLAGMIASLIAQGATPCDSAVMGAYLHGMCGDILAQELTKYSLLPSDVIEAIPRVLKDVLA